MPKIDLRQSLRMLDIEQGGIFPELKRSIVAGNSFLIVGYGGTGGDALEAVKRGLQRYLDPWEMERYVRILAIDSDATARYREVSDTESGARGMTRIEERFAGGEFFWLEHMPARRALDTYQYDPALQSWLDPRLAERFSVDQCMLDGHGASATRQLGRLLLYPASTGEQLRTRIATLAHQLTDGTADRLRVIVVTGVSGGTGSGIAVDATYLIRDTIDRMPGRMQGRTDYLGYILLPPTGKSADPITIARGDRNGYAALKEIDHFMTIEQRGERYEARYGRDTVVSDKNIFTSCYLIDGRFTGYRVDYPRMAIELVADSILDMMTSQPVAMNAMNGFLADAAARACSAVSRLPHQRAPRSANYVYSALDHVEALIPLELMKAYVAKMVFDRIYGIYRKCSDVRESDVEAFVSDVRLPLASFDPSAPRVQIERVRAAAEIPFADLRRGPYYTIDLLDGVCEWCSVEIDRVNGQLLKTRAAKEKEIAQLSCIRDETLRLNRSVFSTYARALDEMAAYLKQQHGIITDHKKMETYCGACTFSPIDLGSNSPGSQAVQEYLVDLVSPRRVQEIATALVQEMIQHRAEWTELVAPEGRIPRFDAGTRIRQFWAQQLGGILSATIEDYLLKYWSGEPDARVTMEQTDEGMQLDERSDRYLKIAAREIVREMLGTVGGARALADLQVQILPEQEFKSSTVFLVPASAPYLRRYIEEEIRQNGLQVDVQNSFADDRLSCYTRYTGLPAFMFTWVSRAEPRYEQALKNASEGLHRDRDGAELPGLLPRDVWPMMDIDTDREAKILSRCSGLFFRARDLGLAVKTALPTLATVGAYTLYTLPAELRPDAALFRAVDAEVEGSPGWRAAMQAVTGEMGKKVRDLFAREDWAAIPEVEEKGMKDALANASKGPVAFEKWPLRSTCDVMVPLGPVPDDWDEELAVELLRQLPDCFYALRGTVSVLEWLLEDCRSSRCSS